MLKDVDEGHFRAICQTALEGLAAKKLNLDMLVERRARARERRVVPESIARFMEECARDASLTLKPVAHLAHAFDPGRTPPALKQHERAADWKLPPLAARYPPPLDGSGDSGRQPPGVGHARPPASSKRYAGTASMPRRTPLPGAPASIHWATRRRPASTCTGRGSWTAWGGRCTSASSRSSSRGRCEARLREPRWLGDLIPAAPPGELPAVAALPEATAWLNETALTPFLEEIRSERTAEVGRIAEHVELSLTEVLHRADEEIGRAAEEVDRGSPGAEGRLAQAEARHAEALARRERRREELQRERAVTLQGVERLASALIPAPPRARGTGGPAAAPEPRDRDDRDADGHGLRSGAGVPSLRRAREEPRLRRDEPRPCIR